jgi:outer membrane protein OmpA-like peptidoglycan-associated protein
MRYRFRPLSSHLGESDLDSTPAARRAEREAGEAARAVERGQTAQTLTPVSGGSEPQVLPAGGRPLPPNVQRAIEPSLGVDLSQVRVHDDARAHRHAAARSARAFTQGQRIGLSRGASPHDLCLMAHEAAHTVQQRAAGPAGPVQRQPKRDGDDAAEPGGPGRFEIIGNSILRLWNFDQGDREPKSRHLLAIDQLRDNLRRHLGPNWPGAIVSIIGYASPEGTEARNQRLSEGRAERVADHLAFLMEQDGIAASSGVWLEGAGEVTGGPEAYPYLRRVDVEIAPLTSVSVEAEEIVSTAPAVEWFDPTGMPEEDLTLGDVVTGTYSVADAVVTVGDTAMSATGAGGVAGAAFSMAGGVAIYITGFIDWAGALQTGDNITWCRGASYAFVALANGQSPPGYPSGMDHSFSPESADASAAVWQAGVASVRQRIADDPDAWKDFAVRLRAADPEQALNAIYQSLADAKLQDYFLVLVPTGGVGYDQAMSYRLRWPGPSWYVP